MSKRILIVEDEESIADLEKDYLELSNFEAVSYTHLDVYKRQITLTAYPAISLPAGGNTRAMQPRFSSGRRRTQPRKPRKRAYPIIPCLLYTSIPEKE